MVKYLLMLVVILSINYSMPAYAVDKEPFECMTKTYESIIDQNGQYVRRFHMVIGPDVQKYVDFVNAERMRQNLGPLESDKILFAELKDGAIGMAMFQDDCLVPGTFTKDYVEGIREWFILADMVKWMELFDIGQLEKDRLSNLKGA